MDKTINFLDTVEVELFRLYIHNLKWVAGLTSHLSGVVKSYGNKVYNVRFDKLLQSETDQYIKNNPVDLDKWRGAKPYISVKAFTSSKIEIGLYGLKSSVYGGKDCFNNDKNAYFPSGYDGYYIAYHWTNYPSLYSFSSKETRENEQSYHSEKTTPEFFYYDDNCNLRIHSTNLAALLVKESKDTMDKALQLEKLLEIGDDGLTEVERDRAEYERIKKEAERLCNKLPCGERDFFNIKAYASWS